MIVGLAFYGALLGIVILGGSMVTWVLLHYIVAGW